MMTETAIKNTPATNEESAFMWPIWKITLLTMIGTSCIAFAAHLLVLEQNHKENMQQVEQVEFRTKEYTKYRDIYKNEGKAAATASLNAK